MDQKQFEALLSDAEIRLRRLKTLYDQWLSGFERLEPTIPRKELDELLARLKREHIRNTALRFRLQQVSQRYVTFTTYWKRLARQIEEGTYQRDVLKARKIREEREQGRAAADGGYEVDVDVDLDVALAAAAELAAAERAAKVAPTPASVSTPVQAPVPTPAQAPAAELDRLEIAAPPAAPANSASLLPKPTMSRPPPVPPRAALGPRSISPFALPLPAPGAGAAAGTAARAPVPPPPPRPAPPATSAAPAGNGGGLSSDDVQRIYARYVAARKDNSERVDNVRIESIEKSLRTMLPQLEKKHAGKKIDFEVVVKDGKVALKPVPK